MLRFANLSDDVVTRVPCMAICMGGPAHMKNLNIIYSYYNNCVSSTSRFGKSLARASGEAASHLSVLPVWGLAPLEILRSPHAAKGTERSILVYIDIYVKKKFR